MTCKYCLRNIDGFLGHCCKIFGLTALNNYSLTYFPLAYSLPINDHIKCNDSKGLNESNCNNNKQQQVSKISRHVFFPFRQRPCSNIPSHCNYVCTACTRVHTNNKAHLEVMLVKLKDLTVCVED